MSRYFRPWRRTFAVVTLAIACLLAAGWVRSTFLVDNPYCPVGPLETIAILSQDSSIGVVIMKNDLPGGVPSTCGWETREFQSIQKYVSNWGGWRSYFLGIGYMSKSFSENRTLRAWFVPYWSIVIPLTMLSVYWLLSGRASKHNISV